MHTIKESPYGTNQVTARIQLDVRIILAVLWAAGMLSSLNGDTYRLSASTEPLGVSPELLLIMSSLFVGSILMSVLTLTLKSAVSRWANRIIGICYAMITLAFEVLHLVIWRSPGYEIVWATAQLVFALLVVWFAWKWTNPEE
jgi:fucose 4-O-acetylase-like acetyltransferase